MINGRVNVIRRDMISGWVADYDDPYRVLEIAVLVDGVERGRYLANRARPDLRALGIYGAGDHGFAVHLVPQLSSDEDHEVIVRPLGGWWALERGHVRIAKDLVGEQSITVLEDEPRPPQLAGSGTPRYVLHVGPHKTGTTYLQLAFNESRNELSRVGIFYPDASFGWIGPDGRSHTELYHKIAALETASLPTDFGRLNASDYNTILISSEDLVSVSGQGLRYLKSLIEGRPVEIVFYCRRWSELLPSLWQESVKQGMTHSLGEFLAKQLLDPMKSSAINFCIVIDRYAEVFGSESIKLVSYNHLVDSNIDLYEHFVKSFFVCDNIPLVTRATPNRSLDPVDSATVQLLNQVASIRSEPVGIDIFNRYWRNRSSMSVASLHTAMARCLASIRANDACPGLRAVHDFIFERYGDRMVDPNSGYGLFLPAIRDLPFVQTSYLFAEGVMQSVISLYEDICGQ